MNHVLARVKRFTKKPFFKLISDHTLYENIDISLSTCVPYSPDHNLDEDSWFKIDQFSQQTFCIDFLKNNFSSQDYDDLKKEYFPNIAYILAVQGDDFYFQRAAPSLFVKKKMIGFGEVAEIKESSNHLVINNQPDAIYFKSADALVFRNLASVSGIFKGIEIIYREATRQETESFLQSDFVELRNNYNADKVSKPNRKRIALAMDSLENLSGQERVEILAYIGDYCSQKLTLNETTRKFEISTDDELKLLLYGIEQRFYTTPFGQEKRLANSVQRVS